MTRLEKFALAFAVVLLGFALRADHNQHEGRIVYHSQCGVSLNPVRYEGFSGKVSVRVWWYTDTVTGASLRATEAQHGSCEAVKVMRSNPAEVAEAERLEGISVWWRILLVSWVSLIALGEVLRFKLNQWREDREALAKRDEKRAYLQELEEERLIREKKLVSDRLRSKRANEERARRKAERGAELEARRLANLKKK